MNMSQFSVPSVSLCESLHLGPFQPFLMHCGNHGNTGALSIKVAPRNISDEKADGRKKLRGHRKSYLRKKKKGNMCL